MSHNPLVDQYGNKHWYKNGTRHRDDGPAIIYADGTEEWHQYGRLHRTDGPAVVRKDGTEYWYIYDEIHRVDGPAIKDKDGEEYWYIKDQRVYSWDHFQKLTGVTDEHLSCLILKYGQINYE